MAMIIYATVQGKRSASCLPPGFPLACHFFVLLYCFHDRDIATIKHFLQVQFCLSSSAPSCNHLFSCPLLCSEALKPSFHCLQKEKIVVHLFPKWPDPPLIFLVLTLTGSVTLSKSCFLPVTILVGLSQT